MSSRNTQAACLTGLGLALTIAGPASAQIGTPSTVTADADETDIVVSGQRAADRNAIQAKRSAIQVIDAISADDMGQIADFSVGDALKRIAGVNTFNYQGEPRFATIRGFNSHYITTTLDGLEIASPDNQNQNNGGGRQFYLESLPSNIASRIEVIKTSTPDMAGHSVGGSINFAIPSAFDYRGNQFRITARGGAMVLDDRYGGNRPTYQGEALLTRRFGVGDRFGLMLNGSYWRRDQWIPDAERGSASYWYLANGRNSGTPYNGTGPVGSERRWMVYDNSRERGSVMAKLDWHPGSGVAAALTGFYFTQHETAIRNDTIASVNASATVSGQTATTGRLSPRTTAPNDIQQSVRRYALNFDRRIYGGQADVSSELTDALSFNAKAGYSHATFRNPQVSDNFVQGGLSFDYQNNDDGVLYTPVDPARYDDASRYVGGTGTSNAQHMEERYFTDADHYEARLRLGYHVAAADRGFGIAIGGGFIRNAHDERYEQTAWNGMRYTLADVLSGNRACSLLCNQSGLFLVDEDRLRATLSTHLPAATPVGNIASAYGRTFGVREDVASAYLMSQYRAENWFMVGGLRLEHTDFLTNGYQTRTDRVSGTDTVRYIPVAASVRYDHWLPSLAAAYDLRTDMRLRAGYSRTIGRPKFTDMGLLGGALNLNDINNPVLSSGNPDLKPRRSDNFDFSYEWYLDRSSGLLSLALFHKAVHNEIYLLGRREAVDVGNGVLMTGTVTTPVNSTDVTTVSGVEFNFVKFLDFLPGVLSHFGINANGTLSRAHFPIRLQDGTRILLDALPNQARTITNLSLLYEDAGLHARVAWNHSGWFIEDRYMGSATTNAASFYRLRWSRPANIIDASISYDLNERLSVRLDGTNLTGQGADDNNGIDRELPVARYKMASALMAGIAIKF